LANSLAEEQFGGHASIRLINTFIGELCDAFEDNCIMPDFLTWWQKTPFPDCTLEILNFLRTTEPLTRTQPDAKEAAAAMDIVQMVMERAGYLPSGKDGYTKRDYTFVVCYVTHLHRLLTKEPCRVV